MTGRTQTLEALRAPGKHGRPTEGVSVRVAEVMYSIFPTFLIPEVTGRDLL